MTKPRFSLAELAILLQVECRGNDRCQVNGLATLAAAKEGDLCFLANTKYKKYLTSTKASAVIFDAGLAAEYSGNCLISSNPYLTYAKASQLFDCSPSIEGMHPSAVISPSAVLGDGVSIGANCVVGDNVHLGTNTSVGAGSVVGNDCMVGADTLLHPNVTLYYDVQLGDKVVVHSGAVLGGDGFGFSPSGENGGGWVKVAQLGGVRVGSRVEIGAGTTIDRGALENTVIEDGVILDNQIQIAHNVQIGENTAIAAYTGIAGSSIIGKNCILAGRVSIVGHISIADNTQINTGTLITKSITESGSYSSGTGSFQLTKNWKKNAVRFSQLDDLNKRVRKLEKK